MTIDKDFLIKTARDLIRINSINPTLVSGGAGEREIAQYVAGVLRQMNVEVQLHEPVAGRISVAGILRGMGGGRSLMLNAHMDTVGIEGMPNGLSSEVRDGRLYGRGAYDMKGSLAACLAAMKALAEVRDGLKGEVVLAAVADEEYESIGTADFVRHHKTDAAIVTEATELDLCLAHKGFAWLEVQTFGRAAHGSRFDEGIDANMRMGRFLAQLEVLERQLRARQPHPLLGPPSLHAALINGGTGLSTYADHCSLKIERRTIPGESEAQVIQEIRQIVDRLAAEDPSFHGSVESFCYREPFEVLPSAAIVGATEKAAHEVLGRKPKIIGQSYWMDSALLGAAGIETVIIGPSGAGAHAVEEWVEVKSLVDLAQILALAAVEYCG